MLFFSVVFLLVYVLFVLLGQQVGCNVNLSVANNSDPARSFPDKLSDNSIVLNQSPDKLEQYLKFKNILKTNQNVLVKDSKSWCNPSWKSSQDFENQPNFNDKDSNLISITTETIPSTTNTEKKFKNILQLLKRKLNKKPKPLPNSNSRVDNLKPFLKDLFDNLHTQNPQQPVTNRQFEIQDDTNGFFGSENTTRSNSSSETDHNMPYFRDKSHTSVILDPNKLMENFTNSIFQSKDSLNLIDLNRLSTLKGDTAKSAGLDNKNTYYDQKKNQTHNYNGTQFEGNNRTHSMDLTKYIQMKTMLFNEVYKHAREMTTSSETTEIDETIPKSLDKKSKIETSEKSTHGRNDTTLNHEQKDRFRKQKHTKQKSNTKVGFIRRLEKQKHKGEKNSDRKNLRPIINNKYKIYLNDRHINGTHKFPSAVPTQKLIRTGINHCKHGQKINCPQCENNTMVITRIVKGKKPCCSSWCIRNGKLKRFLNPNNERTGRPISDVSSKSKSFLNNIEKTNRSVNTKLCRNSTTFKNTKLHLKDLKRKHETVKMDRVISSNIENQLMPNTRRDHDRNELRSNQEKINEHKESVNLLNRQVKETPNLNLSVKSQALTRNRLKGKVSLNNNAKCQQRYSVPNKLDIALQVITMKNEPLTEDSRSCCCKYTIGKCQSKNTGHCKGNNEHSQDNCCLHDKSGGTKHVKNKNLEFRQKGQLMRSNYKPESVESPTELYVILPCERILRTHFKLIKIPLLPDNINEDKKAYKISDNPRKNQLGLNQHEKTSPRHVGNQPETALKYVPTSNEHEKTLLPQYIEISNQGKKTILLDSSDPNDDNQIIEIFKKLVRSLHKNETNKNKLFAQNIDEFKQPKDMHYNRNKQLELKNYTWENTVDISDQLVEIIKQLTNGLGQKRENTTYSPYDTQTTLCPSSEKSENPRQIDETNANLTSALKELTEIIHELHVITDNMKHRTNTESGDGERNRSPSQEKKNKNKACTIPSVAGEHIDRTTKKNPEIGAILKKIKDQYTQNKPTEKENDTFQNGMGHKKANNQESNHSDLMNMLEQVLDCEEQTARKRQNNIRTTTYRSADKSKSKKTVDTGKTQTFYDDCYNVLTLLEDHLNAYKPVTVTTVQAKNKRKHAYSIPTPTDEEKQEANCIHTECQCQSDDENTSDKSKKKISRRSRNQLKYRNVHAPNLRSKKELRKDLHNVLKTKLPASANFFEKLIFHPKSDANEIAKRDRNTNNKEHESTKTLTRPVRDKMNRTVVDKSVSHTKLTKPQKVGLRNMPCNENIFERHTHPRRSFANSRISHETQNNNLKKYKSRKIDKELAELADIDKYVKKLSRKHKAESELKVVDKNKPQMYEEGRDNMFVKESNPIILKQKLESGKIMSPGKERYVKNLHEKQTVPAHAFERTQENIESSDEKSSEQMTNKKDSLKSKIIEKDTYEKVLKDKMNYVHLKSEFKNQNKKSAKHANILAQLNQGIKSATTRKEKKYFSLKVDPRRNPTNKYFELNEFESVPLPERTKPSNNNNKVITIEQEEMMSRKRNHILGSSDEELPDKYANVGMGIDGKSFRTESPQSSKLNNVKSRHYDTESGTDGEKYSKIHHYNNGQTHPNVRSHDLEKFSNENSLHKSSFKTKIPSKPQRNASSELRKCNGFFYYPAEYVYEDVDDDEIERTYPTWKPNQVKKLSRRTKVVPQTNKKVGLDPNSGGKYILNYTKILHIYPELKRMETTIRIETTKSFATTEDNAKSVKTVSDNIKRIISSTAMSTEKTKHGSVKNFKTGSKGGGWTTSTRADTRNTSNNSTESYREISHRALTNKPYDMSDFVIDAFLEKPTKMSNDRWMSQHYFDFGRSEGQELKKSSDSGVQDDISEFHNDDEFLQKPFEKKQYLNKNREMINKPLQANNWYDNTGILEDDDDENGYNKDTSIDNERSNKNTLVDTEKDDKDTKPNETWLESKTKYYIKEPCEMMSQKLKSVTVKNIIMNDKMSDKLKSKQLMDDKLKNRKLMSVKIQGKGKSYRFLCDPSKANYSSEDRKDKYGSGIHARVIYAAPQEHNKGHKIHSRKRGS